VYAEEVEECLKNSGFIADCRVYGTSDKFGNEIVCADIVTENATLAEVVAYAQNSLAPYKIPKKFTFVENIEKSNGKVKR